jgi:hypothetical protein
MMRLVRALKVRLESLVFKARRWRDRRRSKREDSNGYPLW